VRFRDQAVAIVLDQLFRSARIGNDHRNAGGLRFNDHVAERVRGARKNEDVGGGVSGREFPAGQISGEESFRERFGKLARIGPVADNTKLDR